MTAAPTTGGTPPASRPATYRLQVHAASTLHAAADGGRLPGRPRRRRTPTSRRCCASARGQHHGYDTVDHAHIDEPRGGRDGLRPARGRAARARARRSCSTSCPTTWASPTPAEKRRGGGTCCSTAATAAHAARVRHRLGVRRRQGAHPGARRRRTTSEARARDGRRRRAALLRATASRSRPAPATGDAAGGARPAALRAGRLAARRHRAELPPVLRDQHPRRAAGGGPGGLRRHPRAGAAAGRATARSTGCGSTTPTGWPTRRATSTGWPRPPGDRVDGGREDPRARRGAAGELAGRRAPPATTRWPRSTRCSSTRPARRR